MKEFDLNQTIPLSGNSTPERAVPMVDEFDLNDTKPIVDESIGEMLTSNLKEAAVETGQKVMKALGVVRWPFKRFIEHPVSTIATALQEPEGKTVGGTLAKAAQAYVPFKKIPEEEYGAYAQIWDNYYQAIMPGSKTPNWYLAMASYGTAVGVEIPATRAAMEAAEFAATREVAPWEADIIRKMAEPMISMLRRSGVKISNLNKDGNIIRFSENKELFINKYMSAVLRGDKIRVARWAKVKTLPVPTTEAAAEQALVLKKGAEILPLTGKEVVLPVPPVKAAPEAPTGEGKGEYQHILRKGTDIEKLKIEGFKSGIGPNAMLRWKGKPTNIIQTKYAPKEGDKILYIPKEWIVDTPNGPKIKQGFIPKDENIVDFSPPNPKKPTVTTTPPVKPPDIVPKGAEGPAGEGKQVAQAYEKQKDIWFGKKDLRVHKTKVEKASLQKAVKSALGKKKYDVQAQEYDKAIQLYIDTKRSPEDLAKFYKDLTPAQKKLADLSQNLPPKVQAIADKISESYTAIGLEAQDADIIKNVLDNYVNRTWDLTPKQSTTLFRKFGTTTPHAKRRVLNTILEGWAKGYKLKVEGATNNLQILKEEMIKTIEDKRFLKALQKLKTIDGEAVLSTKQLEGYKAVEHPNFKVWRYAGEAEQGKVYGKNVFVTDEGTLMERKELYAPEAIAKNMNNILGISKLKGIPGIDALTKFNAVIKATILQTSFFHHQAFIRSYSFGTNDKKWGEMSPRQAYRQGLTAIELSDPIVELGVKNGLTLGIMQDWNEELLREKGFISNILDKNKVTGVIKDKIMNLRQNQADFLFGKFGAGLKAKAFMIEYGNLTKKHPKMPTAKVAKMAANLINDDFGGLHLQRMGRNPTVQHIFRLVALAPDWTESNVRTMIKAFKAGGKEETEFYRKFWAGIFTKAAGLTVLANMISASFDEDDKEATGAWQRFLRNYKRAWSEGKFRWMDVDITPLYKAFGGKTEARKYFSVIGHFKDPIKFILHPVRSAHHKGSVVYKFFHEALVGADWAGRRFTTIKEAIGIDPTDKKKKKQGKTVSWSFKGGGPLKYEQLPSFMVSQIKGWMPIQVQNLMNWMAGEMEGFDAILKSLGGMVSTTYEKKKKTKSKF